MTILLVSLLLIEAALLVSWNQPYFRFGLPLFRRRVVVPTAALLHFPFGQLEREVASGAWPALLFHPMADRSCAFRESFGLHLGWRYPPLMRGRIVIDRQRSEIRVLGLGNWTALFAVGSLVPALAVRPAAAVVVASLLGVSYLMQRRRFIEVEAAVRRLMVDCEPPQLLPRVGDRCGQRVDQRI